MVAPRRVGSIGSSPHAQSATCADRGPPGGRGAGGGRAPQLKPARGRSCDPPVTSDVPGISPRARVHPFLDPAGPVVFAHRGGAGEAPENTLEAFEIAVNLGYSYLETDVHRTGDGVLVAFHDDRLDRVTDRIGRIAQLPFAAVRAADAGFTFSRDGGSTFPFRGRGIRVTTLEEILECWPAARVNIDPKADMCVEPLVALLNRLGAWPRVCIGSFSDRRLHRIRALARGQACTSMGPQAVAFARLAAASGTMRRLGADCIQVPIHHGPVRIVTRRFVTAAHRAELPVHVWTINDPAAMNDLLDLGVDGIMSDRLELLRDVFTRRGLPLNGYRRPTA